MLRAYASTWDGIRDDYLRTPGTPDFLSCDGEGAEVEVFHGAQRLLKEKRPGVTCEMPSEENQRNRLDKFSRFGYGCKPCVANHLLALPQ